MKPAKFLSNFWLKLSLLAIFLAFPFLLAIRSLVYTWWTRNDYSHGFLIPFIALYLAWTKRDKWVHLVPKPGYFVGGGILFLGAAILFVGRASGVAVLEELSLVWMIAGLVLFIIGWDYLKTLLFPIAYLLFMVPWLDEFVDQFHWPFQILSANIGVWLMRQFDFPILQEGRFIVLPNVTLEVAQECSGVRFLVSIIAVGIPLVYLTQRKWSYRFGVIGFGILVAILANGIRVALVSIMAFYYGVEAAHGPLHIFHGFLVAQVGFLALFVANWRLRKRSARTNDVLFSSGQIELSSLSHSFRGSGGFPFWLALVFLFLLGTFLHLMGRTPSTPLRETLATFPKNIDSWAGKDFKWLESSDYFPGADATLLRIYRNNPGEEVRLYVGYYTEQHPDKVLVNYHSRELHRDSEEVRFHTEFQGRIVPHLVNMRSAVDKEGEEITLFWYQLNDHALTGRYETKVEMIRETLLQRRSNGAVVLLATSLKRSEERNGKKLLLQTFAEKAIPYLEKILP